MQPSTKMSNSHAALRREFIGKGRLVRLIWAECMSVDG